MKAGDTLLIGAEMQLAKDHLWFVITGECELSGRCAIVSLTTLREGKDQTMVLDVGDHPFIKHPSIILYQDARLISMQRLDLWVAKQKIRTHKPCSAQMLRLIQDGLLGSDDTAGDVEDFCRRLWKSPKR